MTSDVGVATTVEIIRRIEKRVAEDKYVSTAELQGLIRAEIADPPPPERLRAPGRL